MAMSRKHYRETAQILHDAQLRPDLETKEEVVGAIAVELAAMFKRDNSAFSLIRFMDAIFEEEL